MHWLTEYLQKIRAVKQTRADTEMSYRPAIDGLLAAAAAELTGDKITVINEPRRQGKAGAPDYRIEKSGNRVIGYMECKAPGADLRDLAENSEQIKKYKKLSANIMLTDSWHWLLLRDGKIIKEASLPKSKTATISAKERERFTRMLALFLSYDAVGIGNAKDLAAALAERCGTLHMLLAEKIKEDEGLLNSLYETFLRLVYRDMKKEEFADAFAQTTTYSLLMAKLQAGSGEKLDLYSVKKHIPQTFALIRQLSGFLDELENAEYKSLKYAVDDILHVINNMNVNAIAETMTKTQKAGLTDEDDPFMFFYENFLAAYNKKLRKERGVYYTPLPVVRFIVRAVDDILKEDFKIADGLADKEVTSLDFATGTGTFMLENMRKALDGKTEGKQKLIIKDHLLPNCYGFEYLIAPYVIAHLKLSRFLKSAGYKLDESKGEKQLKIYLTDTLEHDLGDQGVLPGVIPALAEETKQAQVIKQEKQILVIMGNPPYVADSKTPTEVVVETEKGHKVVKTWIGRLLKDYQKIDGKPLNEANPRWVQDDYVKFIRFAQYKMESAKRGIVAVITNHNFLDNPTFRGMRNSLLKAFNRLYFLDLQGNARRTDSIEDIGKDENVFQIQMGVCISLFIKNPDLSPGVFHCDLRGTRQEKYDFCQERSVADVDWKKIKPTKEQFYVFQPHDEKIGAEHKRHPSLTDIFEASNVGIIAARNHLTYGFSEREIRERVEKFAKMETEKAREKFSLGRDVRDWSVKRAQDDLNKSGLANKNFRKIAYRPFDLRHTYYTGNSRGFHCMPRREIMSHIINIEGNIGLVSVRQVAERKFKHVFAVNSIVDGDIIAGRGIAYLFPLYLYNPIGDEASKKSENIKHNFRKWIDGRYGKGVPAESIMFYVYAVLHSPEYRKRYADFLRLDYPRIPFPKKIDDFNKLAKIGGRLMNAHLLKEVPRLLDVKLHGSDSQITEISHSGDELRINKSAYFSPVPQEIFAFSMCGHLPLDQYLKARKDKHKAKGKNKSKEKAKVAELTLDDVDNVKAIVNAVQFTIDQMKKMPELEYGAGWKD